MHVLVRLLNGELIAFENVEYDELPRRLSDMYETHLSQVELVEIDHDFDDDTTDTTVVGVLIHPKPRIFLSDHELIYDMAEDDDPWSAKNTSFYRTCANESILRRLFRLHTLDDVPTEVFANPADIAVEWILTSLNASLNASSNSPEIFATGRVWRRIVDELTQNPHDDVIDLVRRIQPHASFRGNSNPRCMAYVREEIDRMQTADPDIEYSESTWLKVMLIPYASREVIEFAVEKLRTIDTGLVVMKNAAYEFREDSRRALVFEVLSEIENSPNCSDLSVDLAFERHFYRREFSLLLERLSTISTSAEDLGPDEKERLCRLAAVADSDEVMAWFVHSHSNHAHLRRVARRELSRNPHPLMVEYLIQHPAEIDRDAWLENKNPRTVGVVPRNISEPVYGSPAPHHLLSLLSRRPYTPRLLLSTLLESFGQTNEVEVIFDTDISIQFLNGERMWVCPSWWRTGVGYAHFGDDVSTNLQHLVAKRRGVALRNVELVRTDEGAAEEDGDDGADEEGDTYRRKTQPVEYMALFHSFDQRR